MEYEIGEKYKLFRDGNYLGIGVYSDDPANGLCFLIENFVEGFGLVNEVCFEPSIAIKQD